MHSVIIVDDELFFRKGLVGMIDWEGNGYQVIGEAANGEDALVMIRDKKPDLVITDIQMPVLDGLALIQAAEEEKLDTEFVIISGHTDFRYAQQAVRFGVLDYVLKPIDEADLVNALVKLHDKLEKKIQPQARKRMLMSQKQIETFLRGESTLDDDLSCKLVEAVEENDAYHIRLVVDRIFSEFSEKRFSPEEIQTGIVQCVLMICKSIRSMEGDETELTSFESLINWYHHNVTLDEIKRLFNEFLFEAGDLINRLYRTYGKGRIHKIKTYIDQNYSKNISLRIIAGQFYFNPAYLGQLFKKNYGMYFNQYLQQLRITEAKKLLRMKDLRIYEVAERVGFNNSDYFVTQFDKLERMSPSEYRNQWNLQ
ncbi:response regulator transcription factor [Paenibacillus luteus]|uniref:response regulator transcription factor n=1 Tax=Paenibacillus luteus TaxID=2545753 RepID=UPI001143393D|nr:response regulator [Paenibacillus luteus]